MRLRLINAQAQGKTREERNQEKRVGWENKFL